MSNSRPPYDPELEAAMLAFQAVAPTPVSLRPDDIHTLRELSDSMTLPAEVLDVARVEEHLIAGADGRPDTQVSVVRLKDADDRDPLPGMLFVHGGGMVAGNRFIGLDQVADWMSAVPMVVVSVEYRLAPENPHPAPVEDCYAALVWMADHAAMLGIDASRLAVAGASAGGGLAAAVALLARDRRGPELMAQLLGSPMLDDRAMTASSTEYDGSGTWDMTSNATGWAALLGSSAGGRDVSPYAAPARAESLADLPATFIDVGSAETFRDEVIDYAARIWTAGGKAELHVWPGGFHGFDSIAPMAMVSHEAREARVNWLRRTFAP